MVRVLRGDLDYTLENVESRSQIGLSLDRLELELRGWSDSHICDLLEAGWDCDLESSESWLTTGTL